MKLKDLVKNMSTMTDDELREHVKHIRNQKYNVRPAHEKHKADAVKKVVKQTTSKVDKLLKNMSEEDKRQLLLMLEEPKE